MRRPILSRRASFSVFLLITACAQNVPRAQVQQASVAYSAVEVAADPLLDELAGAEREAGIVDAIARTAPEDRLSEGDLIVSLNFDPAKASFFASIGEPPATAALRRGLRVGGDYIKTLVVLAEGSNVARVKEEVHALAGSLAGLAAIATGGFGAALEPAVGALDPIVEQAIRAQNAEELRRLVLQGAPPVDQLLEALVNASTGMFNVLRAAPERAATGKLFTNKPARRAELEKIAAYNVALSNYVLLLNRLRETPLWSPQCGSRTQARPSTR